MNKPSQTIVDSVQKNCHISDARHASDYTLCIYLLKMREYYRWEKGLNYDDPLNPDLVGAWLNEREALWNELDDNDFHPIGAGDTLHSSFDSQAINNELMPQGFIYSAGYGPKSKAIFCLAELEQQILQDEYNIFISGREFARDLTAPVAMSQQNNIYIRRESLHRMIWEKTVEWGWHQNKNAMFKAMNFYDFADHPEESLDQMTEKELNSVILHEIGEIKSAKELRHWQEMTHNLPRSKAEIMTRAIKDMIADAISTLPALINNQDAASLHFYFANFTHMRKELAPDLLKAYQAWDTTEDYNKLLAAANRSGEHWLDIARDILDIYEHDNTQSALQIESLINENKLEAQG